MRKILLLMCAIVVSWESYAQDITVSGRVTSNEDGSTLPGVNVILKGTSVGAVTDADGKYSLSVPSSGGVLVFSFIGLESKEVEVRDRSVIDVSLVPNITQLSEIVITGSLGLQKQAKELGYAASTLISKDLTQAKAVDVAQSLNGKVSGLNITTTNSGVFQNSKINIRGIRSLTGNNQPMLVVDGAQVPLSNLYTISPEDIGDITVLKSAASAALYGPDAVNGVLIVTTKRGKSNQNPTVTVSSSFQASSVAFFPKLQHSFGQGAGEPESVDQYGNYGYVSYENQLYGPRFDGTVKQIGVTLPDGSIQTSPYNNAHKNDKTKFWNTGSTLQNGVSLTGSDYFLSIQDAKIKGLMPEDQNRRTTLRFNGDKKINKFSINYGLGYTLQKSDVVNEAQLQNLFAGQYSGSIMFSVLQTADNIPLLSYKNQNNKWASYSNWYNEFALPPYWIINNLRSKNQTNNLVANTTLGYEIAPWLKATARINASVNDSRTDNTQNPLVVEDWTTAKGPFHRNPTQFFNAKGAVFNDMSHNSLFNIDYFLNGKTQASDLTISYLVGANYREINEKDVAVGGNNLVVPSLSNVSVRSGDASTPGYASGANGNAFYNYKLQTKRTSAYGTLGFGFRDWAFIELTGRNDWDSRLAPANRSFFYPSANASLVLSDAISSLKSSTLSYLKVRGAFSKSANVNIAPYSLQATYSQPLGFPFGSNVGFTAGTTIPSPNLKPETVISTEVGIEVGLLDGKFDFEATFFNQDCKDQVLTTSLPISTGYSLGLANAASFTNKGLELDLGIAPYKIGKGRLSFKINATYNTNKVTKTLDGAPVITGGASEFIQRSRNSPGTVNNIAIVGSPAYQYQLTDYVRDPATGKVIVDAITGYPSQGTNVIMGRSLPLWIVGFTPKFEVGGLAISMTWDYKGGHNFYSGLGSDMDFAGISARSASYGRQRFVFPNSVIATRDADGKIISTTPNTNVQVQDGNYGFWTGSGTNTGIATNYFASAAAFRLREVNITYNFPQKWFDSGKFIKKVSLSAIGRNLLLFVPKSNQWGDPEFNYSANNNTYGIGSAFQTPASRLFGGNLSITF